MGTNASPEAGLFSCSKANLTFQVKRTSRCSDKALSLDDYWFSTSTPHAGFNGWTLHSIPFSALFKRH